MKTELLIIEPNLRANSGHYGEFVRALASRSSSSLVEIFAHPDADEMLLGIDGVALCQKSPRVGESFAEWRTIRRCISTRTTFLLLTADGRHGAAASVFARFSNKSPVNANFFFHRAPTTWRDKLLYPFGEIAREYSRAITSTEQVAESLKALGWKRVEYIPYPAIAPAETQLPVQFSHLLMAGAARLNKGLDLVTELACKWAGEGREIPLFVQVSKKHLSRHGKREKKYVEKLLASGYKGLRSDDKAPDRSEYVERFKGALVLAPYARQQFASQVSGVVLDALLNGAPVIATKGTWSALQVERFGAGITISERSVTALGAAIDTILSNWDSYSLRACEAATVLAQEHDPIHLAKLLGLNSEE